MKLQAVSANFYDLSARRADNPTVARPACHRTHPLRHHASRQEEPSFQYDRAVEDPAGISQTDEPPGCQGSSKPTSLLKPSAAQLALRQDGSISILACLIGTARRQPRPNVSNADGMVQLTLSVLVVMYLR